MLQDHVIRQALPDRGDVDDHWARVFGALCLRCGRLIEETDFARRRTDDEWVHEQCPAAGVRREQHLADRS